MGLSDAVFRELQDITGRAYVTREPEELLCYSFDSTGKSFRPDAVIFPGSTREVSRIMTLASRTHFCVIPRGSGSGMTGGTLPIQGGVILVFSRMNRILDINTETLTAMVEPGVITGDFHQAVEKLGLFYPPDPASSAFCTLGGNVAECAGGPRAVKYGVTRDYVLGLEAVLPSGEIIHTGVRTAKGVAGYDLTRLIVGSEGTLAVVTRITLKLLPLPESVRTMAVVFTSMKTAARTVSAIIRSRVIPRCVEFLDKASIGCVIHEFPMPISGDVEAILILEVDGARDQALHASQDLRQFCLDQGAADVVLADNPVQAQALWKARKALSPALFKLAPDKINEDIVVPINLIPDMVEKIESIRQRTRLSIVSFGHAGDGNIHCNIMYNKQDERQAVLAASAVDELFEHTLKLGGTITGEHGVGITKKKYLPWEIGAREIALMGAIKTVFDPAGILNPGKIF
ncbi:MAG: FAD-linked oxidase C-terminal domain-containing protein [Pseudomonadota bacterium]